MNNCGRGELEGKGKEECLMPPLLPSDLKLGEGNSFRALFSVIARQEARRAPGPFWRLLTRGRKKSQSLPRIKPRFLGHPDRSLVTIVTEKEKEISAPVGN
jgi:hypothetical protein